MGMFDTVRSSYPLISPEADYELQTKDLANVMTTYWISPSGHLYEVRTRLAYDAVKLEEHERKNPWQMIQWVRNGKHGVVTPEPITRVVTMYPGRIEGEWAGLPEVDVYFRQGVIQEVTQSYRGLRIR